jgi:fatty acid desaturase
MRATGETYLPALDVNLIRKLSAVSTTRWLAAAMWNWAIIAGAIAVSLSVSHWAIYLIGIMIVGTRQHALGVLMHEGVHYRVAPERLWNDLLSDWMAGYPLVVPTEGYRAFHLKHHRLLDTQEDPERVTIDNFRREWIFPMPRLRLYGLLLRDLSGLWPRPAIALLMLTWKIPGRRARHLIPIGLLHASVALLTYTADCLWALILFWWVPLLTVFPACFRLRTVTEHSGIRPNGPRYRREEVDVVSTTRTTVSNAIGRFFLAPHGINYHTEHHLYPSVPYFRLREVHRLLQSDSAYASQAHIASGYAQVVGELTRTDSS